MAEHTDFDMYGRKIFFLNPAYAIKKDIISNLRKKEYYNLDMNTKYVIYKLKCPHNSKNFLMD